MNHTKNNPCYWTGISIDAFSNVDNIVYVVYVFRLLSYMYTKCPVKQLGCPHHIHRSFI